MAREVVSGSTLNDYIESKLNKQQAKSKEQYKATTPAEKGRLFEKIKNELGLVGAVLRPELDKIKNKFMAGKINEDQVREQVKSLKAPVKKENEEVSEKKSDEDSKAIFLTDIASKKM